jgi:alpha-tubulin suppressor-like RCC1 family protein
LQVEASSFFSQVNLDGGYLYTWGQGYFGQLTHGSLNLIQLLGGNSVQCHLMLKSIAAGANHCLGIYFRGIIREKYFFSYYFLKLNKTCKPKN